MLEKILVALDHSLQAAAVFDFAVKIAQPEQSKMLLVHFIDWQMQDVSPWVGAATLYDINISSNRYDWSSEALEHELTQSKIWLENYRQKAIALKIDCQAECHTGKCSTGISDRAQAWGADVIVIGRRGRRNVSEILLGSVSNHVVHHAPCSVLVVQKTYASSDECSTIDHDS